VGSQTISQISSGFVIGSHTLGPGSVLSEGGQQISIASSGNAVIVNGATPTTVTSAPQNIMPVVIIGTSTITENSNSQLIIGTQTLTPGGVITYNGETITLSPSDGVVIVSQPSTFVTKTAPSVSAVTAQVLAGQTLTSGGVVTVGGDILSLAPSGTQVLIVGTVTVGGEVSTATATGSGAHKNTGEKIGSSIGLVLAQFSFVVLAFLLC
jgi:hypothetical protein